VSLDVIFQIEIGHVQPINSKQGKHTNAAGDGFDPTLAGFATSGRRSFEIRKMC
jgi:hypothetical protein